MKANRLILVGILLLAIISIGFASAADTINDDNSTVCLEEDEDYQVNDDVKTDLEVKAESNMLESKSSSIQLSNFKNDSDAHSLKTADFNFTVDGKSHYFSYGNGRIKFSPGDLKIGKHDFELRFVGNDRYNPFVFNDSFTVCKARIANIPDKIVYGHQSNSILVEVSTYTTGSIVSLEINGKTYSQKVWPYEGLDDDDEMMYYENENQDVESYFIAFELDRYDVSCGNHTVVVKFNGEFIGQANVLIDYVLEDSDTQKIIDYGSDASLYIHPLDDMDLSKISVKIEGIECAMKTFPNNGYCIANCSGIAPGTHNVSITYSGDNKYNRKTFEYTKEVQISIKAVYNSKSEPGFYLPLPDDAQGRLYISVKRHNESEFSDKLFANVSAHGNIYIPFDNLTYGHYTYEYNYTGNDYKVYRNDGPISFIVNPKFTLPLGKFMLGDVITVSINLSSVEGSLTLERYADEGESEYKMLEDGKAEVSLKCTTPGKVTYRVYADLDENDGKGSYMYWQDFEINVINPIISKDASPLYSEKTNYQVQIKDINGNKVKSGKVTFYILDSSKQILRKTVNIANGVAKLSYKITQGVKTYKIKTVYKTASVVKKLTVKHVVKLKTVTVKKSAKKLVLQATLTKVNGKYLKGKLVTFKFNGKTYKVKTNSKGVAKYTIKSNALKKLKVGKQVTYQATYLKDTVKKTAKIKK